MDFYLDSLIKKEVSQINSSGSRINRLTKIRDIVIATQYHPNPLTRYDSSVRQSLTQLKGNGEFAINKILKSQFEAISKAEDIIKECGKYEMQEWQMLRGHYPSLYLKTQDFKRKIKS